ncbi:unnamed protein product [Trifolium pratense]|uniref:Uncharacterized protein n=1 Tax=Trifolium pratense TaxID=57577 RepID=A0ACB0K9A4_TRIPR|nr:unnamed protein product [Trifolium pratense]
MEMEMHGKFDSRRNNAQKLYAVYLVNMTTNVRIWKALNSEMEGSNMNIIKKVLQPYSGVVLDAKGRNCFHNADEDKKLGQVIDDACFEFELLDDSASAFNKLSIRDMPERTTFSRKPLTLWRG